MRTIKSLIILVLMLHFGVAHACPLIGGIIDYNCDGKLKLAFVGDSVVKGVDDSYDGDAGYVLRIGQSIKKAKVSNLGVPGITTLRLFTALKQKLSSPKESITKSKLLDADYVFIDVGRNDFFEEDNAPLAVRNIRRMIRLIRLYIGDDVETPPFVTAALLTPTPRETQQPFIDQINALLAQQDSVNLRVGMHFNTMPVDLINDGGIHPTPEGYDYMAAVAEHYIRTTLQDLVKTRAKDTDKDGVYDYFETRRYHTDPKVADTDGDGFSDGVEIFKAKTDPLNGSSVP